MKQLKRASITGFFFVLIGGTLLHFLYEWTNKNPFAGLFAPVNESVWEHMKLLFFPMLAYSFAMVFHAKENRSCIISASCLGILAGTFSIPVLFYAYTAILGKNTFAFDLATFVLSTAAAFFIFYKSALFCRLRPYTRLLCILTCALFLCFMVFSYDPPGFMIFLEP